MKDQIGLFGLGDLGKRLVVQLEATDHAVYAYDPSVSSNSTLDLEKGIDPAVTASNNVSSLTIVEDPGEILANCSLIHWAVPSNKLEMLPTLAADTIVILHDSVMSSSVQARAAKIDASKYTIVHCLMNASRRVFIDSASEQCQLVLDHFKELQLSPKWTTVLEHDRLMARSQGIFALLIALGMKEELETAHLAGDLTPSADELRLAVANREANWTSQTLQSILSNPELIPFLDEIMHSLFKK